jgi:hypothetical protein
MDVSHVNPGSRFIGNLHTNRCETSVRRDALGRCVDMRLACGAFDRRVVACPFMADGVLTKQPPDLCSAITIRLLPFYRAVTEVVVSMRSVQVLTWGTMLAAFLSAVLLAGEDAALPDLSTLTGADQPVLGH